MRPSRASSAGFTLIELTAALALTGILLVTSGRLLSQLSTSHDVIARYRHSESLRRNGLRLARDLISRVQAAPDSADQLTGDASAVSFLSWCDTPAGALRRCHVTLALDSDTRTSSLQATIDGAAWTVWRGAADAALRYVDGDGAELAWMRAWDRSILLPAAIAITTRADTTLFAIAVRADR
ncbi:MAG TPA: prepilin-type N-terminal cleavage/methylation domain-containing protein [Gemmatimonadaceae bacterium]|nr:prepilin-type N-terminal cleavage/methylation domain-containing protein [Gemmatimonadaceae bacterium]